MKYLFDGPILSLVEEWIHMHQPLIGFDFDGTLAPIVKNPSFGTMKKKTRALFIAVARRYRCVVISGRGRRDVAQRLPRLPKLTIIGNHGMEWEPPLPEALELEPLVHDWGIKLQEALYRQPHVFVEVKRFSITIHYRREAVQRMVEKAVNQHVHGARHIGGKNVINLVPRGALNKGTAFALLRKKLKMPYGVFLGDDVTDQDVFCSTPRSQLITIQIGRPAWSTAKYYVKDQSQMDRVLRLLLKIRT